MKKSSAFWLVLGSVIIFTNANHAFARDRDVPGDFASFYCVEKAFGSIYRVLRSALEENIETVVLEERNWDEVVKRTRFQVTSVNFEGDMILVIQGNDIDSGFGAHVAPLKFKMATTVGENHSLLVSPQFAEFSCSFR